MTSQFVAKIGIRGDTRIINKVCELLNEHSNAEQSIISALAKILLRIGEIGSPRIQEILLNPKLLSKPYNLDIIALFKLGTTGDPVLIDILLQIIAQPGNLNASEISKLFDVVIRALRSLHDQSTPTIIETYLELMRHSNPKVRSSALRSLGRVASPGDERVATLVLKALTEETDPIPLHSLVTCIRRVALKDDPRVQEALLGVLAAHPKHQTLQIATLFALGASCSRTGTPNPKVVVTLVDKCDEPDNNIRGGAVQALVPIVALIDRSFIFPKLQAILDQRSDTAKEYKFAKWMMTNIDILDFSKEVKRPPPCFFGGSTAPGEYRRDKTYWMCDICLSSKKGIHWVCSGEEHPPCLIDVCFDCFPLPSGTRLVNPEAQYAIDNYMRRSHTHHHIDCVHEVLLAPTITSAE